MNATATRKSRLETDLAVARENVRIWKRRAEDAEDALRAILKAERYPYRHAGPAVYGSKLADFLVSEVIMEEDQ